MMTVRYRLVFRLEKSWMHRRDVVDDLIGAAGLVDGAGHREFAGPAG